MSGWRLLLVAAVLAGTAAGLAVSALTGPSAGRPAGQRVDPEENEPTLLTARGRCGVERWAVKTLTDPAAKSVNLVAKRATVAGMNALPAPTLPSDNTTRYRAKRTASPQRWSGTSSKPTKTFTSFSPVAARR